MSENPYIQKFKAAYDQNGHRLHMDAFLRTLKDSEDASKAPLVFQALHSLMFENGAFSVALAKEPTTLLEYQIWLESKRANV